MVWSKNNQKEKKSHAKGRSFSWLMYLILISCSLTSVTLSKYTKTITGTATGSIAQLSLEIDDNGTSAGTSKARSAFGRRETVTIDRLSDGGYYVFRVKNYNAQGIITEVPMMYSISINDEQDTVLSDFKLYQTDDKGNVASEPMSLNERITMSTEVKQEDIYVIQFDASLEGSVQVTIIAEQI